MMAAQHSAGSAWRRLRNLGPSAQGGVLLVTTALVALVWANSPWAASYERLWETELGFALGGFTLEKPVLLWVNDGLMAVFFLLVGLEIKRELLEGTLATRRQAALPLIAAVGGMAAPAVIYLVINASSGDPRGWAIPAATDIAFALGILAVLGSRVPLALKIFLTAVAVVDDLGAIAIIAVFFTETVAIEALVGAGVAVVGLAIANRMRVTHPVPYLLLGALLWLAVLKSGVHATVAGVVVALFIPIGKPMAPGAALARLRAVLAGPGDREDDDELPPDTVIHRARELCNAAESPLHRWEHALQPWVLFGIMPVFALANAGVVVVGGSEVDLVSPLSVGVALGLLVGKPLGITLFSWLAVRAGLSELPPGVTWARLHAVSWLGGIGFTMSLFIAGLAIDGPALASAKISLLVASACAGVIGTVMLVRTCPSSRRTAHHSETVSPQQGERAWTTG